MQAILMAMKRKLWSEAASIADLVFFEGMQQECVAINRAQTLEHTKHFKIENQLK
jgi:hypothetical protein